MKSKRVLVFASYFAPNSFSEALTNNKFVLALKRNGYEVTIISTGSYTGEKYENQWSHLWEPLKDHTYNLAAADPTEVNKQFKKIVAVFKMKHPIMGVSWAYKAFRLAKKLHQDSPFDLIISRSISDFGHLPALQFKKETKLKWVANWNDPPFFIFPPPYEEKTNAINKFWYLRYLRDVSRTSDLNTFPSKRLFNYMTDKLDLFSNTNIEILPHLNTDLGIVSQPRSNDVFRICHAGNLSKERSPELFLKALKLLCDTYKEKIECSVVGLENVGLKQISDAMGLQSVLKFTGPLPYHKTLEFLGDCSVGLLIEAKCNEGIFLPSKISDYVQAELPILAVSPKIGTVKDVLGKFGGGLVCDNSDENDIYSKLEALFIKWRSGDLYALRSKSLKYYLSDDYMLNSYEDFLTT